MLNQLIESKNHRQENARRKGFLLSTLGVLVAVLLSGWTYSLFAKNFAMNAGDFELSRLVAPVAVADEPPPPKEEIAPDKAKTGEGSKVILKAAYDDLSSSKNPPKDLSGEKNVVNATQFDPRSIRIGNVNQIPDGVGRSNTLNPDGCGLCRNDGENRNSRSDEEEKAPEIVKPTPAPTPVKIDRPVSLGVINGKATFLAKPPYSAAARTMGITGAVHVQVTIDEQGSVISASVVSGHPLLRPGVENAARQSRFTPTFLSKQPVKVTGVIVYQFKP